MPSPDQTQYNTLLLYDKGPYELIQQAIADAVFKLPGFSPKVGDIAMTWLEANALITSELQYAINRLPDAVMDIQMQNFGIVRDLGTPATTTITITVVDTLGYTLPAGIEFRLEDGSGNSVLFLTDVAATVAPGSTVSTVAATTNTNTDIWNGTVASTSVTLISPIPFIQTGVLATSVSGGADAETDDEWRSRAVRLFQSLSSVLVLPDQFTSKALTISGVERAFTKDNWNVTTSATGHVTVAVADSEGLALSAGAKTDIQTELDAQAMAALIVHVVDPDYNEIDVSVDFAPAAGYTPSEVQTSVVAAVTDYLSPANWEWNGIVRRNELISLVDQVPGVDYVDDVQLAEGGETLDDLDVTLTGPFPLTEVGTILATAV